PRLMESAFCQSRRNTTTFLSWRRAASAQPRVPSSLPCAMRRCARGSARSGCVLQTTADAMRQRARYVTDLMKTAQMAHVFEGVSPFTHERGFLTCAVWKMRRPKLPGEGLRHDGMLGFVPAE